MKLCKILRKNYLIFFLIFVASLENIQIAPDLHFFLCNTSSSAATNRIDSLNNFFQISNETDFGCLEVVLSQTVELQRHSQATNLFRVQPEAPASAPLDAGQPGFSRNGQSLGPNGEQKVSLIPNTVHLVLNFFVRSQQNEIAYC